MDLDTTQTSRSRLLFAGKTLFAKNGYEKTSTSAIAREAGTSESQLVRYFSGKAGLLEAIFNESWKPLNEAIGKMVLEASDSKEAIFGVLSVLTKSFGKDHDLAFLFLFEGRRIRGDGHEVLLSAGFVQFSELLGKLIQRGQSDGTFGSQFNLVALTSALMGAAEGMIRDRVTTERTGNPAPFNDEDIRKIFSAILAAF